MSWLIVIAVIAADQITKYLVSSSMAPGEGFPLIQGILDICYVRNSGAAFSSFSGKTVFLVVFTVVLIAGMVFYAIKNRKELPAAQKIALALIIGGGIGNLADRLRFGSVVDFIETYIIPVFNVADMAITCGGVLLFIAVLAEESKNKRKKDDGDGR